MILRDEKINHYTVVKQTKVIKTNLYNHNALSMMIETFLNLQKENDSKEQAEKRYVDLSF